MQTLLFDFDGVIVHTEPEYDRFLRHWSATCSCRWSILPSG